jgi:hypothetical protein
VAIAAYATVDRDHFFVVGLTEDLRKPPQGLPERLAAPRERRLVGRLVANGPDEEDHHREHDPGRAPEHGTPAKRLGHPGQRRGRQEVADLAEGEHPAILRGNAFRRVPAGQQHHAADEPRATAQADQEAPAISCGPLAAIAISTSPSARTR